MNNNQSLSQKFKRQMLTMAALSIFFWVIFILFFRTFWPGNYQPGDSLTIFWLWFIIGATLFALTQIGLFHLLKIPPAWRTNAAAALAAPALCLDLFSTMFFEYWFPHGSPGDLRIYPAFILGGVGILLFIGLFMTTPEETPPT
ncbi:MAG TPA: DUF5367 family protein [Anaerolineae bacterium]|nr:DUF5367 family protein [Anaerolineae bacterium]